MNYRDFIENRYFPDMSTSEKAYVIDQMKDDLLPVITGNTVLTKSYVDNIEIDPGVASEDYLTFTAVEAAGAAIRLRRVSSAVTATRPIEYRKSNTSGVFPSTWTDLAFNEYDFTEIDDGSGGTITSTYKVEISDATIVSLASGQSVQYRNKNANKNGVFNQNTTTAAFRFYISSGKCLCDGNVMSLVDKNCTQSIVRQYAFYALFYGCTNLLTPPKFPATRLSLGCYYQTFQGCSNLRYCPDLPAKSVIQNCYYQMFYGCTTITETPKLMAPSTATTCYYRMFYGCTKLKTVYCNLIDNTTAPTNTWLQSVPTAATWGGKFYKSKNNSLTTVSFSWIPKNWTVYATLEE